MEIRKKPLSIVASCACMLGVAIMKLVSRKLTTCAAFVNIKGRSIINVLFFKCNWSIWVISVALARLL